MKKFLLCVALALMFISPAHAKLRKFGQLTVDVPSGWTGEQQGTAVVVKSPDGKSSVTVAVNSMGEASLEDIVERMYTQMDGTNLEQDDDGDYTFYFTNLSGVKSVISLTADDDGHYIIISMTGYDDAMNGIIDSLDWDDE